ncbi:MAG: hypothetical protein A2821_04410 [Candidatus Magasanikbacteria bacterium RIFCSPHIGHO2_01_FULL_41_23]|uniref:Endolytic murein transglycosylase n=1 Tax=Candidatus Magasanikbacteria bacterium RIFCSPLOWO2_01_FULL_40_15 TaxID=1798686 RepID=A0A1F6N3Y4_9BACT|nr:MAG: hypothetical protein A2821_04410 [Candidatus Magasanikbacteria bacterium RIFCSPHIGHO2_01_FULL_41_23]OGH67168.1 MAG: hypothetical protein A3C66_02725 [Candidatus Magasanikbacteria bacterium RIFCSPHIGHO2_02_FULL_41_35]OGH75467.1 MAG: hypothetical protein A3F22_01420 [Candidatus Magasanikbacteria bacterium RIFCSPHIGHO2_12_FULL_41_16]OGH78705.1 MAG: hypothetical protein A2983_04365 [Candidatus Magasanikbacteria bacterium RIFCSPLOWO2_01_FULL_40_15]
MRVVKFVILSVIIITVAGLWWRQTVLKDRAEKIVRNARVEKTITIIPGWDLRDVAEYLVQQEFASSTADVYVITGLAARANNTASIITNSLLIAKPRGLSLEGYLAPDTYRVYADATVKNIISRLASQREKEFSAELQNSIKLTDRSIHEILTMAGILEREVKTKTDKAKVADIFWRRHDVGMGLQADSTVHYATAKEGTVFTSNEDRQTDNFWNTYKYPKLPPGSISNPSLESIMAAINPEKNGYWYFLTTLDTGEVKYARTLAEHNENARRFLKK